MIHFEYHEEGDTATVKATGSYEAIVTEIVLLIMAVCKDNNIPTKKMLKDTRKLLFKALVCQDTSEYIRQRLRSVASKEETEKGSGGVVS